MRTGQEGPRRDEVGNLSGLFRSFCFVLFGFCCCGSFFLSGSFGFCFAIEAIKEFYNYEDYEGNDQKVNYVLQEVTVGDVCGGVSAKSIRDIYGECTKI